MRLGRCKESRPKKAGQRHLLLAGKWPMCFLGGMWFATSPFVRTVFAPPLDQELADGIRDSDEPIGDAELLEDVVGVVPDCGRADV
jgi:hypothetical protein